jgi:hypothetical protein
LAEGPAYWSKAVLALPSAKGHGLRPKALRLRKGDRLRRKAIAIGRCPLPSAAARAFAKAFLFAKATVFGRRRRLRNNEIAEGQFSSPKAIAFAKAHSHWPKAMAFGRRLEPRPKAMRLCEGATPSAKGAFL